MRVLACLMHAAPNVAVTISIALDTSRRRSLLLVLPLPLVGETSNSGRGSGIRRAWVNVVGAYNACGACRGQIVRRSPGGGLQAFAGKYGNTGRRGAR